MDLVLELVDVEGFGVDGGFVHGDFLLMFLDCDQLSVWVWCSLSEGEVILIEILIVIGRIVACTTVDFI